MHRLQRSLDKWRGPTEERLDLERDVRYVKNREEWRRIYFERNGVRTSIDAEHRTALGDSSNMANSHVSSCHLLQISLCQAIAGRHVFV